MTVGENIKRIRKEKGLTQKKLGELCNPPISESNIRKYENGKQNAKIETVDRIASALGVRVIDIMEEYTFTEYKTTSEFQRLEKEVNAEKGIISILTDIYGKVEDKTVSGNYFDSNYYLIGEGERQFILYDGDIKALYESAKSFIIPLVERMKDCRPESDVIKEILKYCNDKEAFAKIPDKYK